MPTINEISNQIYEHVSCPGASQRCVKRMMDYLDKMPPPQALSPLQGYWQKGRRSPFAEYGRFVTKALLLPCIPMHFLIGNRLASGDSRFGRFYQNGGAIGSVHHWSIKILREHWLPHTIRRNLTSRTGGQPPANFNSTAAMGMYTCMCLGFYLCAFAPEHLEALFSHKSLSIGNIAKELIGVSVTVLLFFITGWVGIGLLLACVALVSLGLLLALQAGVYGYQYLAADWGKTIDDAIEKKFFPGRIDCRNIIQAALTEEEKKSIQKDAEDLFEASYIQALTDQESMEHHFKMQLQKALEIIHNVSCDRIILNSAFVDQTLVVQWVKNHQLVSLPMKLDTHIDREIVLKCLYNVLSMLKVHFGAKLYNFVYSKLDNYSELLEGSPHIHQNTNWIELPEHQGNFEEDAVCAISHKPYNNPNEPANNNLVEPVALVTLQKRSPIVHVFEWKLLLKWKKESNNSHPITRQPFSLSHVHRLPGHNPLRRFIVPPLKQSDIEGISKMTQGEERNTILAPVFAPLFENQGS